MKIIEKPIIVTRSTTTTTRPPEVKVNPIKEQTASNLASTKEDGLESIEFSEFVRGGHKPLDHRKYVINFKCILAVNGKIRTYDLGAILDGK